MSNARRPILVTVATLCAAVGGLALAGIPAQAAVRSEVGSFGPAGPGSGGFDEPQSIAVEQSSGDVFVYQAGKKGIVYKFNTEGDKEDFSSTPTSNEIKAVGGEAKESEIALDGSSGPDKGDLYVATGSKLLIYSSTGAKLATFATAEEPCGVAVDPSGAVYVSFRGEKTIKKYTPVADPVKESNYSSSLSGVEDVCDIAVDAAGDVYAAKRGGGVVTRYEASEFNTLGLTAIGMAVDGEGATLAVDPSSGGSGGEIYIDEGSDVAEYAPPATRVTSFGSLSGSYGVAADHAGGEVYAAEEEAGEVAIFGPSSEYPLTVRHAGWGSGTVECAVDGGAAGACASEYLTGAVVTLTATPGSGSEFKGFSEACTNSSGACEVTVDAARSVTATFALEGVAEHTLTISPVGSGAVSANEGAISNCSAGGGVCAGSYPEGAEVELEAKPGQYQQVEWKDCTSVPSADLCVVRIGAANATVTATFTVVTRTITVALAGSGSGSVSATTGEIKDCAIAKGVPGGGTCSGPYPESGEVELEATPAAGSAVAWSGCESTLLAPDRCHVKPGTGDVTVTATLTPKAHTVTVTPDGSGSGSVSASEGEIKDCAISKGVPGGGTCSGSYDEDTAVTLEATPAEGSAVTWSANCTSLVEDTCTVDVDAANVTVTATFNESAVTEYKLKVIPAGTGTGTVTSSPAGINCGATCEASFEEGKKVVLTEKAETGSTFAGWSGGGCTGTAETCEVTISAAESVTATFNESAVTEYELKVIPAGTGTGTVTSSPAGIDCGATCEASFEEGKKVVLTEKAETGSTFAGWSGGGCTGTAETCEVTISAAESVTATFNTAGHGTAHEFLFSFGPEGPGLEPFEEPSGVAVEQSSGDVFVYVSGEGGRIYKFNASGEPLDFAAPATTNVIEGVGGTGEEIAVDSSNGPDHGDIYVATGSELKIYGPEGKQLGTLPGVEPYGVAVGASGAVYVSFYGESQIKEYVPGTGTVTSADYVSSLWNVEHASGIAVNSAGDVYAEWGEYEPVQKKVVFGVRGYEASQFSASEKAAVPDVEFHSASEPRGLAVDAGGDVLIDAGSDIAEYKPSGALAGTFGESGAGALKASHGVAVSESSGDVYAADRSGEEGDVFVYKGSSEVVLPVAKVEGVSQLRARSVTLNGTVNPKETEVTACEFEYGSEPGVYAHSVACSKAVPFTGDSPVVLSAGVSGLQPDSTYYFRLLARNAEGSGESAGHFTTLPPGPGIDEESVTDVSSTAADLRAQIDPRGAATSYYFQYGTTESYGASIPAPPGAGIGSGEGAQGVLQQAQGLAPSSTYHYRVVGVQGPEGSEVSYYGADQTFTTQAAGVGFALPDGRQWEMVSPPDKDGSEPEAITKEGGMIESSEDGEAITYVADGPMPAQAAVEGSASPHYAQILSTRDGAEGWSSQDITTPNDTVEGLIEGEPDEYHLFSPNLALALVRPFIGEYLNSGVTVLAEPPLSPALSPAEAGHQEKTIYLRDDAPLAPEASEAESYDAAQRNGEAMHNPGYLALLRAQNAPGGASSDAYAEVEGATPDLSHVVISAGQGPVPNEVYEWGPGGTLQPVSVLPGETSIGKGYLGGPSTYASRHAISNDGTLVFWTHQVSASEEHLYVRDTATRETLQLDTVQKGEGASGTGSVDPEFQTASADGSKVFFTDRQRLTADSKADGSPDLYVFELTSGAGELAGKLTDLTPAGVNGESADVVGDVLGASEDGSYVYFVAQGTLAPGAAATSGQCSEETSAPPGTTCNLYRRHYNGTEWTQTRALATLSSEDAPDWSRRLAGMTSRVSPNGEYLAFMSDRSLTGYDNFDVSEATGRHADEEVYLYDASGAGSLICASCNPSGARPVGIFDTGATGAAEGHARKVDENENWKQRWLAGSVPGWTPESVSKAPYQSRYLSDSSDSGRLFFDSPDDLVPAATSEQEKVYEYEPDGVGSCQLEAGCVGLISPGNSEHEAAFLDASAGGDDVFFLTADKLVPQDTDAAFDVYDAHECTSSSPCPPAAGAVPPACTTAESCRATPAPQPAIFGAPSSETFSGSGNIAAPVPKQTVKAKRTATQVKAGKLAKALKACKKKPKKKWAACERRAHKKYGAKAKKRAKAKKAQAKAMKSNGRGN